MLLRPILSKFSQPFFGIAFTYAVLGVRNHEKKTNIILCFAECSNIVMQNTRKMKSTQKESIIY